MFTFPQILFVFGLAVGLSADAFAVSVCKGLSVRKAELKHALVCGIYFGVFQAFMPLVGWALSSTFAKYVGKVAPVVAFLLLAIIGGNMVREALKNEEECLDCSFSFKAMVPLAFATSIDAMISGTTLAFDGYTFKMTLVSVLIIGMTTFLLSAIGVKIGNIFGAKYKSKAEFAGGIILIGLGVYSLADGIIGWIS